MMSAKGCFNLSLIIIVAVGVLLVATCPKAEDHKQVIRQAFDEAISEKIDPPADREGDIVASVMKIVGKMALGTTSDFAIERMVKVDDYYVCSVGRIEWRGREHIISVGLLNHVFTLDKEDILEELNRRGF